MANRVIQHKAQAFSLVSVLDVTMETKLLLDYAETQPKLLTYPIFVSEKTNHCVQVVTTETVRV